MNKHLHIVLDKNLHTELRNFYPDYGAISSLIRRFLKLHLEELKKRRMRREDEIERIARKFAVGDVGGRIPRLPEENEGD